MNTNQIKKLSKKERSNLSLSSDKNEIIDLINTMKSIDINSDDAKLNYSSMSDNNGGRILF